MTSTRPGMRPRASAITGGADVADLGTILGVWAHPDDEAYLSGGLMALARDAGSRVVCVTATRGELGTPDPVTWPPHRLAVERTGELAESLAVLGVVEHHWLDYPDGGCSDVPAAEPVERLSGLVADVAPDTVVTFGPDGFTGHPDHRTVSAWATAAADRAAPSGVRLLYARSSARRATRWAALNARLEIFPPGYPVLAAPEEVAVDLVLDVPTAELKVRALAAQTTQTAGLIEFLGLDRYTAWVSDETFVDRLVAR
jgi:LmbE family N-acetylglucosaminyl deacetylase